MASKDTDVETEPETLDKHIKNSEMKNNTIRINRTSCIEQMFRLGIAKVETRTMYRLINVFITYYRCRCIKPIGTMIYQYIAEVYIYKYMYRKKRINFAHFKMYVHHTVHLACCKEHSKITTLT